MSPQSPMRFAGGFLTLVVACALGGCGKGGGGITTIIEDDAGQPIPGAIISIVELPAGGADELVKMVNDGQSLYGWHFKANDKGFVRIKGIPTGYTQGGVDTVGIVVMSMALIAGIADPQNAGQYTAAVVGNSAPETHVPGRELGIVVYATGYRPWVGTATFNSPNWKMDKFKLRSRSGYMPSIGRTRVSLRLYPQTDSAWTGWGSKTPTFYNRSGDVWVQGHFRNDGTYVAAHHRTTPDRLFGNNYSTRGNTNPYTGEQGTKDSPTYPAYSSGRVHVDGYFRKDGTFVPPHTRSRPRTRRP